jgi:hypothetical protein
MKLTNSKHSNHVTALGLDDASAHMPEEELKNEDEASRVNDGSPNAGIRMS